MNKARLGEPGRGIIQFEIPFALRRGSLLDSQEKRRMCVDIVGLDRVHN